MDVVNLHMGQGKKVKLIGEIVFVLFKMELKTVIFQMNTPCYSQLHQLGY